MPNSKSKSASLKKNDKSKKKVEAKKTNDSSKQKPTVKEAKDGKNVVTESRSEVAGIVESCLSCVLCCKTLCDPMMLICGHLMCTKCFQGYQVPLSSEGQCPHCQSNYDLKVSKPLFVHAVTDLLAKLQLKKESTSSDACLVHKEASNLNGEKPVNAPEVCRNVNWKLNFESLEFARALNVVNTDQMPYANEISVESDVYKWKNGYAVESNVCFHEGLRWALTILPCRNDANSSLPKPLTFNLGIICKGWANPFCNKPLNKAKLNVWFTIENLNDCSLNYNSGPRCVKFDSLSEARKRSAVVVSNVLPINKVRDLSQGWIQNGFISIVCKFKVPKKFIKVNLAQLQQPKIRTEYPVESSKAKTEEHLNSPVEKESAEKFGEI